jgi:hypothetical protein
VIREAKAISRNTARNSGLQEYMRTSRVKLQVDRNSRVKVKKTGQMARKVSGVLYGEANTGKK